MRQYWRQPNISSKKSLFALHRATTSGAVKSSTGRHTMQTVREPNAEPAPPLPLFAPPNIRPWIYQQNLKTYENCADVAFDGHQLIEPNSFDQHILVIILESRIAQRSEISGRPGPLDPRGSVDSGFTATTIFCVRQFCLLSKSIIIFEIKFN